MSRGLTCREACGLVDGGIQASGQKPHGTRVTARISQSQTFGALSEGFIGMAISLKFFSGSVDFRTTLLCFYRPSVKRMQRRLGREREKKTILTYVHYDLLKLLENTKRLCLINLHKHTEHSQPLQLLTETV